ncbi:hypothetical protein OQJ46_03760 [Microbulbifer thermotolerans]|uniref:FG-GAP-like repeat-containing protein n=1 Tax=Microbulbifer thermotolerans TaxID=252514 RepID=UPI00224B0FEF|nr:RHS repeat-associated core domain-containing protein [Microbulbifer thermotolerans]MCX2782105.1 hypothetical protein [Microbulbifer thermotolerans]
MPFKVSSVFVVGFLSVFGLFFSANALADISGPSSNTTGKFDLTYTKETGYGDAILKIYKDGVYTGEVPVSQSGGVYTVSGVSSGTYKYEHWFGKDCLVYNDGYCWEPGYWSRRGTHTVTVSIPKPGAISLESNNTSGSYKVSWGAASGSPSRYQLLERKDGGNWSLVHEAVGRSKSFSGKSTGKYEYRVRACYSGCSSYTSTKSIIVVRTPSTVSVPSSSTNGSVTISWSNVSGASSYKLEEQKNGGSWTQVYSGAAKSKVLSGRSTGTYKYRVAAVDNGMTGAWKVSNNVIVSRAPGVPSGFSVPESSTTGIFDISWSSVAGADKYQIEQSGVSGGTWSQASTSKNYIKTLNGAYSYRVRACSTYSGLESCGSWTSKKTVQINMPRLFVQSVSKEGKVKLVANTNWQYAEKCELHRDNKLISSRIFNQGDTYTDTLNASGTYSYTYRCQRCLLGDFPSCAEPDPVGFASTSATVVIKPSTPSLSASGSESYNGKMIFHSDSSGPIDSVRWQKRLKDSSWPNEDSYQIASGHEFNVSGLSDGTWQFRVKNCNTSGCSDNWSNIATVTVWNQPIPSSPVLDPLQNDNDGKYTLKWTDLNSEYVYKYEVRENGHLIKTLTSDSSNPNTPSTYSPPVREDGTFKYVITACNLNGCTSGNEISVTVAHKPTAPNSVVPSVLFSRTGSLNITWDAAVGNIKRYEIITGNLEAKDSEPIWDDASKVILSDFESLTHKFSLNDGYYKFKVRACNQVSSYSSCSNYVESQVVHVSIVEPPVSVAVTPHKETAPLNTSMGVIESDRVGLVNGEFRVSEAGAANYTIPIITGPASGNAAPSISLTYSNEGGNGPLGIGWSISGLSAITVCRRTMEEDGVNGSSYDRFCLDGQRLKLVSGTLGAIGSIYQTSLDSFSRVKLVSTDVGSGKGFEVYRKDGSISYYGTTENSIEANTWYLYKQFDSASNYIEYKYLKDKSIGEHLIEKIYYSGNGNDVAANEIEFLYDSNRLDKIYGYSFGDKKSMTRRLVSISSKADGVELRRYSFDYEASPTGRLRLTNIQECVAENCRPETTFEYEDPDGEGLISRFINPNIFHSGYEGGKYGDINGDGRADFVFIRYDGSNGKRYIRAALGTAQGTLELQDWQMRIRSNERKEWHLVDYNDDGKDDLLHSPISGSGYWEVNYSIGTSFNSTDVPTAIEYESEQSGQMYDFNSDGLPDYLKVVSGSSVFSGSGLPKLTVRQMQRKSSGGISFSDTDVTRDLQVPTSEAPGGATGFYIKTTNVDIRDNDTVADFNGDGIADLTAIASTTWTCTEGYIDCYNGITRETTNYFVVLISDQEDGHSYKFSQRIIGNTKDVEQIVADLNGDGYTDLLFKENENSPWKIYQYNGYSFVLAGQLPSAVGKNIQLYDWNHDGLLDILYPNASDKINNEYQRVYVLINQSSGFASAESTNLILGVDANDHSRHIMDITGDGFPEIVEICANADEQENHCDDYFASNDKYVRVLASKHANKPIDVLTSITNGFGIKTEIQYARLNDPSANVYTRRTGSSALDYGNGSPVLDIYSPMYVVKKVISDAPAANDDSNQVEVHYHYTGARLQGGGRGFLGFEKVTTYDPQNKVKSTTTYRQDYPYIGMPVETAKVIEPDADNISTPAACSGTGLTVISCSTNTLAFVEPVAGKTKFPYISKAVDNSYDIDGTYLGRVETETIYEGPEDIKYGNVSRLIATHYDAAGNKLQSKTTENSYDNVVDENRWHLARLRESIVTTQRFGSLVSPAITRHAEFAYDPDTGLLTDEWVEKGTEFELHTHYEHDRFGNRVEMTITDAAGNSRTSKAIYDGLGRYVLSEVNALDQTTLQNIEVDVYGQPLLSLDINGVSTTRASSQFGEIYFEHHETGSHSTTLKEMCEGCVVVGGVPSHYKQTTKGIDQTETVVYYDRLGREIRKQTQDFHGNPVYVDTQYDEQSRVYKVSEPYGSSQTPRWTVYSYDILGRTTFIDAPSGQCDISTVYSGLTETVTTCGQRKATKKNMLGEVEEVTDNIGGKLRYSYYSDGKLKSVKVLDSTGQQTSITSIEYDILGRKTKLNDPDKGAWTYGYNGFGELQWQRDAKGQGTVMTYDKLGRMVTRADFTEFDSQAQSGSLQNFSRWYYDEDITCAAENRFDGKLLAVAQSEVAIPAGCSPNVEDFIFLKLFKHDRYGRLGETTTVIGELAESEGDFYEKITYDQYSRPHKTYDAANQQVAQGGTYLFGTETAYNAYGYKYQINDLETGNPYYTVAGMNVRGQVTEVQLGNGLTTIYQYDSQSHRLTDILTDIVPGVGQVQNLHYDWDAIGNLLSRTDQSGDGSYQKDLQEDYEYDDLNRLRYARLYLGGSLQSTQEVTYYDNGNIKSKTGVGTYTYGSSRPHAVTNTSTGDIDYHYDANGNLVSDGNGRSLSYTVFDKPTAISRSGHTTRFWYDPDRNRYKRVDDNGSGTITTLQVGSIEKVIQRSSSGASVKAYYRRSIAGVAVEKIDLDYNDNIIDRDIQYLLKDLQGSLDVITTATGQIAEENGVKQIFSFDPWGKRRNPYTWAQLTSPEDIVSSLQVGTFNHLRSNRGYTGHEMLDEVGLIHMNGRVYDPTLARFVSADPLIDGVTSVQGYNRYAYVHNNPLVYTDPSGYSSWRKYRDSVIKPVAAIAISIWTGGMALTALGAAQLATGAAALASANGMAGLAATLTSVASSLTAQAVGWAAAGGAIAGGLTGGEKGAFIGAFTAVASLGIGQTFQVGKSIGETALNVGSHALVGGIGAKLGGGKFAHGFFSAGFNGIAKIGVNRIPGEGFSILRVSAMAIVGGTISDATGGKFANGAVTGALQQAFNGELSRGGGSGTSAQEERTWGSYLPGTEAGDNAARYWADRVVNSEWYEDPLARIGLSLSVLWTDETAATTAITLSTAGTGAIGSRAIDFLTKGYGFKIGRLEFWYKLPKINGRTYFSYRFEDGTSLRFQRGNWGKQDQPWYKQEYFKLPGKTNKHWPWQR